MSAAAGRTPDFMSAPPMGTDAHSHPGSTRPAQPATGTASTGFLGKIRCHSVGGTKAMIAPESSTPSIKKGSAWTTMEMKIVEAVVTAGVLNPSNTRSCAAIESTMISVTTNASTRPLVEARAGLARFTSDSNRGIRSVGE